MVIIFINNTSLFPMREDGYNARNEHITVGRGAIISIHRQLGLLIVILRGYCKEKGKFLTLLIKQICKDKYGELN